MFVRSSALELLYYLKLRAKQVFPFFFSEAEIGDGNFKPAGGLSGPNWHNNFRQGRIMLPISLLRAGLPCGVQTARLITSP